MKITKEDIKENQRTINGIVRTITGTVLNLNFPGFLFFSAFVDFWSNINPMSNRILSDSQ